MSELYDGPIFDATHTTGQHGGAVVPQRYLEVNQGRIADMLPGMPGMAEESSAVIRDRKSGHRMVQTYDSLAENIEKSDIKEKPFIGKLFVDLGKTGVDGASYSGYVLDYRYVHNLMYPCNDFGYDPVDPSPNFKSWREIRGTTPALGTIFRYNGEVHYVGELTMIPQAAEFAEKVDAAVAHGFKRFYPLFKKVFKMSNPAAPFGFDAFHEPGDVEASRFYGRVSQKLR